MSDLAGVRALIDNLSADPMLAMSQGSKELFHSDLLAWFLERFPAVQEALLDAWGVGPGPTMTGAVGPRREWHHLDLVLQVSGRQPLVVENKMFSLPDKRQLDRYTTTVKQLPGQPSLVLLSLIDPGWSDAQWTSPDASTPWIYRSYQDLIEVLEQVRPDVANASDGFAGMVLDRWLAMLKRLEELTELVGCPGLDEPLDLDPDISAELQRLRLDAPVQKMRYQLVATQIRRELADELPGADISAGLTNRAGLVQGTIDRPGPRLGWQLQRQQFRLTFVVFAGPGHGRSANEQEERRRLARRNTAFFDFDQVRELLPMTGVERPPLMAGQDLEFYRFDPGFAYRYVSVAGITVGQAIDLGVRYTHAAYRFQPRWPTEHQPPGQSQLPPL